MNKGTLFEYIEAVAKSDVGAVRSENQDFFGVVKSNSFQAFFVADGMGGARGGKLAASKTVEILGNSLKALNGEPQVDDLRDLIISTNHSVYGLSSDSPELRGMGTTLVGLTFSKSRVLMVNVGDSRIYRLRGNKLYQLTEDHTVWNDLIRNGSYLPEGEFASDISHMLTRSIGPDEQVEPDVNMLGVEEGDIYLLCTDGLYNMANEGQIVEILRKNSPSKAVDSLISLANKAGGKDNITVMVVKIKKGSYGYFPSCNENLPGLRECDLAALEPASKSYSAALKEQLDQETESTINSNSTHNPAAYSSKKGLALFLMIVLVSLATVLFGTFIKDKNPNTSNSVLTELMKQRVEETDNARITEIERKILNKLKQKYEN